MINVKINIMAMDMILLILVTDEGIIIDVIGHDIYAE
jgi:hypothetical protein